MLSPHYISTRPAMLASRYIYILSATFWTVLWKGFDRENLPSLSFQFCIHFLLCCIHVHSFLINLFSVSIHVLWFCIHFLLISICFLSFFLHLLPFWAFISFHVPFMSFLHSLPSTLTIISFYIILFISFFPFVPSMFVFISLHFAFVFFHFPFMSFQFRFISFHVAFISFHLASVSFHFALEILSLTPDMAIENGNHVFYVQFLQPILLKESRKVPSVFALFMNIAIKKMHRKWCWQWCMWINVCVRAMLCYILCAFPATNFL